MQAARVRQNKRGKDSGWMVDRTEAQTIANAVVDWQL